MTINFTALLLKTNFILKGQFTQMIFMLFQTCVALWNTKEDIFKNVSTVFVHATKVNGVQKCEHTNTGTFFLLNVFFCVDMRWSKWWQNLKLGELFL